MVKLAEPANNALNTHTKTAVRNAAETAEIQVPLKRIHRQIMFLNSGFQ
jgi:hypothetical protein